MRILVIVPARAGSKGIKKKNFINFLGKPLIEHTLSFAKKLDKKKILICSDYKKIKKFEKKFNTIRGYSRPKNLSKDKTKMSKTLYHAINWAIQEKKIIFDYILILQPTSPIRFIKDFKKMKALIKTKKIKSLCSVVKVKHHPSEYLKKEKNLWKLLIKKSNSQRQDYEDYYFIDGSYYFIEKNYFMKKKEIITKNSQFFPISLRYPIDLDDHLDLKIAKVIYKQ
tara:strand:+ start:5536 stop:6210 length:675 start_codon:yes stop_codon:yes gene_type:complete